MERQPQAWAPLLVLCSGRGLAAVLPCGLRAQGLKNDLRRRLSRSG
ncbi:hypothetical protein [Cyanobium sp. Morenito 9A2]|nr:hypothetical protein [Cyanobium sp. Morenito 9A2]MCP9848638.1 hypothetical protein [Cyanobium sp. Morenito 9A2]